MSMSEPKSVSEVMPLPESVSESVSEVKKIPMSVSESASDTDSDTNSCPKSCPCPPNSDVFYTFETIGPSGVLTQDDIKFDEKSRYSLYIVRKLFSLH